MPPVQTQLATPRSRPIRAAADHARADNLLPTGAHRRFDHHPTREYVPVAYADAARDFLAFIGAVISRRRTAPSPCRSVNRAGSNGPNPSNTPVRLASYFGAVGLADDVLSDPASSSASGRRRSCLALVVTSGAPAARCPQMRPSPCRSVAARRDADLVIAGGYCTFAAAAVQAGEHLSSSTGAGVDRDRIVRSDLMPPWNSLDLIS